MQHAVINDWCVLNQHTSGLYLKGDHIYCILQTNHQSLQKSQACVWSKKRLGLHGWNSTFRCGEKGV